MVAGINFSMKPSMLPCVLESDTKSAVDLVMSGTTPLPKVEVDIGDINRFVDVLEIDISFIPRAKNKVADCLATFALSSSEDYFYLNFTPPSVESVVLVDWSG
ncbi:hypothetical protein QYF36_011198 [Acer negundo]|nr:hypothetical protein QYF36_011198 [Acer negundo]